MDNPMDNPMRRFTTTGLNRRRFLAGSATTATALGLPAVTAAPARAGGRGIAAADRYPMWLALLGTAGGPSWWNGITREGISSAVVVDGAVYLVDCGAGAGRQLFRAGLDLADLRAIFITHLHSDHISDYFTLQLYGWYQNLEKAHRPVHAYGPGDRGALPPLFGHPEQVPPVISPDDPTPGLVGMTDSLLRAYATDINDRMRDNLKTDLRRLVVPHDIEIPADVPFHPNDNPTPDMAPFVVHEDDRVRVSATLVKHAPAAPAFGFRFDSHHGSVVFSGDTGVCDNLVRLATGADVLVHEVVDDQWIRGRYGQPPYTPDQEALINHHLTAHTPVADTGRVAERAGVPTLVLNHFVPGNIPESRWAQARKTYSGRLIVGRDLDRIGVGRPAR